MKSITKNGEWSNNGKKKMREQVALPPTPREKHERKVHPDLQIWRKEQKLTWDSLLIKHNDVIVAAVVVTIIMPIKQKCDQMVLVSLVLFMRQTKNRLSALEILVLFSLKHIGVEEDVSQCLRHFLGPRPHNTWPGWAGKRSSPGSSPCLKSFLTQPYLMKIWMCPWCLLVVCCLWNRLWSIISPSGTCTWGWLWCWARCPFSSVLLSFGFSGKGLLHKMRPSQPTGREAPVGQRAGKIILLIVTV